MGGRDNIRAESADTWAFVRPGALLRAFSSARAEASALGDYFFALEFLNAGNTILDSQLLHLNTSGLFTDNGLAFDYKQYTLAGVAPAGTATVRVRVSMVDAMSNPVGSGQAFVVDDFELTDGRTAPEPATLMLLGIGGVAAAVRRVRRRPAVQ